MAIHRDPPGRSAAELIVEDLERQDAVIARRRQRLHEGRQRQIALSGEATEVPAPLQQVHLDLRRVRDLDEEYSFLWNGADAVDR